MASNTNPADAIMRYVSVITTNGVTMRMGMVASSQETLAKNVLAQFPGYRLAPEQPTVPEQVVSTPVQPTP